MPYKHISFLILYATMNFHVIAALATVDVGVLNDNEITNEQSINVRTLSKCGNDGKSGKGKGGKGGKGKERRRVNFFTDEDCDDEALNNSPSSEPSSPPIESSSSAPSTITTIELLDEAQSISNDCAEEVESGNLDPALCLKENSEKYLRDANESGDVGQNLLFKNNREISNEPQELTGHTRRHLRKVYSKHRNADKVL
eukprot:CAMPEP_0194414092 /NCGR_PEP_ID=MMETSP0176-20130528/12669_1 /TAXON_ID=216777 /ORGANISM="Proboscia alata, Strain PI-D3" /LENGTH=198 /DNA_ID=CAMNT_0039217809 /DNA_START=36 /DNA_END=632 /DNA_ORIENTATION=-